MDETNNSETPDSATPSPAADAPGETVSRDEFNKSIAARQSLKEEKRALEARIAELTKEKPPAELPTPASPGEEPPPWAKALVDRLDGLEQGATARTRESTIDNMISGVPEANRETAKLLINGIEASGLDLSDPQQAAKVAEQLESHSHLFIDATRGKPRRTAQIGPDGKPNFAGMSLGDISSKEDMAAAMADPKTRDALLGNANGVGANRPNI